MRVVLIIVMILGWLVAAGLGVMIGNENLLTEDAQKAAEMIESMGDSPLAAQLAGFRTSGMGGFIVALLTTLGVIVTFMKKSQPQLIIVGLGVLVAVLFMVLSPSVETGAHGGMGPRGQAVVYGIASIVALLAGLGAEKIRQKKAAG